jgi:hypothetical protein
VPVGACLIVPVGHQHFCLQKSLEAFSLNVSLVVQINAIDVDDIQHLVMGVTGQEAGLVERKPLRGKGPIYHCGDSGLRKHWINSRVRYTQGRDNVNAPSSVISKGAERQI